MNKRLVRLAVALAISGGLLAVLVGQVDLPDMIAKFRGARLDMLAWAGATAVGVLALRGMRFVVLTDLTGPDALPLMSAIMGLQNFLTRITPFRTGELAVPYFLERYRGRDPGEVLVKLVWVRFVDLFVLIGVFVASVTLFSTGVQQRMDANVTAAAAVLLGLIAVFVFTFGFWFSLAVAVAQRLARAAGLADNKLVRLVLTKLEQALVGMASLGPRRIAIIVLWTVATWVFQYAIAGFIIAAFGIEIDIAGLAVGMSVAQFAAAIPVASIGNIGTHEAGWVVGFTWVGLGRADAVLTGLAAQFATLVFAALLAVPCWLYLRRKPEHAPAPARP